MHAWHVCDLLESNGIHVKNAKSVPLTRLVQPILSALPPLTDAHTDVVIESQPGAIFRQMAAVVLTHYWIQRPGVVRYVAAAGKLKVLTALREAGVTGLPRAPAPGAPYPTRKRASVAAVHRLLDAAWIDDPLGTWAARAAGVKEDDLTDCMLQAIYGARQKRKRPRVRS